jgi:methionyl-tRNA formyltransferase
VRIVFMGSPDFAVPTLRRLTESEHHIAGVVTQPDRPRGRGRRVQAPAIKALALEHRLPVLQPERVNTPDSLAAIGALQPDALIIAAYGQILRQPLLDLPRLGSLNVHASLLPKYRGASPVAAAILQGEQETGVTILEVVLALDAGPMLAKRSLPIDANDTTGTLTGDLADLGADLLIDVLPAWERGDLTPEPQDDAEATYAPSLSKSDATIDWAQPAVDIWRQVRAYNPWPVATTSIGDEPLRVLEAWPQDEEPDVPAGTVLALPLFRYPSGIEVRRGTFAVRCGRGSLAVMRVQRAGKHAYSGGELVRGMPGLMGQRLGT